MAEDANAFISIICWIEVMAGGHSTAGRETLKRFLAAFDCIPLDAQIADMPAVVRRRHKLKLPDAVIYATAQIHQATLITRNTRDFLKRWKARGFPTRCNR